MRLCRDKILRLKLSEEPIYALGIYFSYNDELATKKTCMINLGRYRKFSTFGYQETFLYYSQNTCAVELTFVNSLLNTPDGFTQEDNKIIF